MSDPYIKDNILREDCMVLIHSECPIRELAGTTVLVTGATGMIGSQIVKTMACANEELGLDIHILALCRDRKKFEEVFDGLLDMEYLQPVYSDINSEIMIEGKVDYIIHGASPTSSQYFVQYPVETIMTLLNGTKQVLDFARKKEIKGMVYLSTLEIYGIPDAPDGVVTESQYGYIDHTNVRSSYSGGKRMAECLCVSYAEEYGVPVKIIRLSQTFGADVEYHDGRVFAEFLRCAIEKKNIVLHTEGKTLRTYCYTRDAVSAVFYVLLRGKTAEAYNASNENTAITIRDMAQLVCDTFPESNIEVEFDVPENLASFGYNPEMVIRMDTAKIRQLGWEAAVGLQEMFERMEKSVSQAIK